MNPERYRLLEEARRSLPDSYKVELSGDLIVAQAPPSSSHQLNLAVVQRQFEFGETVRIPEPLGFDLDLARLVPYRD